MTYSNLIQLSIPFSLSAVNYGNCVLFVFLQQSWTIIIIISIFLIFFIPQVVKIPGVKNYKS